MMTFEKNIEKNYFTIALRFPSSKRNKRGINHSNDFLFGERYIFHKPLV